MPSTLTTPRRPLHSAPGWAGRLSVASGVELGPVPTSPVDDPTVAAGKPGAHGFVLVDVGESTHFGRVESKAVRRPPTKVSLGAHRWIGAAGRDDVAVLG